MDGSVRVRVPATSANLGPGFDALGLALSLHDMVEARTDRPGLTIEVAGQGEATAQAGESHLVVRAMRETFGLLDGQPPGLALRCANRIPHGRGLGSSAAAIVSGILAARALADGGADAAAAGAVLRLASELEGHPDNVAACLLGGLTIAWTGDGGARATRLSPLHDHRAGGPRRAGAARHRNGPGRAAGIGPARRRRGQRRPQCPARRRAHQRAGRPAGGDPGLAAPALPGRGDAGDRGSGPAAARGRRSRRGVRGGPVRARVPGPAGVQSEPDPGPRLVCAGPGHGQP